MKLQIHHYGIKRMKNHHHLISKSNKNLFLIHLQKQINLNNQLKITIELNKQRINIISMLQCNIIKKINQKHFNMKKLQILIIILKIMMPKFHKLNHLVKLIINQQLKNNLNQLKIQMPPLLNQLMCQLLKTLFKQLTMSQLNKIILIMILLFKTLLNLHRIQISLPMLNQLSMNLFQKNNTSQQLMKKLKKNSNQN